MIHDYKTPKEPKDLYLGFPLLLIFICIIGYAMYQQGYADARYDYSQPIKYRCHEGIVYRSNSAYWEKTNQSCKPLEDIK